jgi:hypothetical protein
MEKRKALQYPEKFIAQINGITLTDIFQSKRDTRKIAGGVLYQIMHRVEPITSLYIDLTSGAAGGATSGAAATSEATNDLEGEELSTAVARPVAPLVAKPKTAEEAKVGAIIGQTKKVLKLKKAPSAPAAGSIGGSGQT